MKKCIALAALLATTACATSPLAPSSTPVTLSTSQMDTIRAAVTADLLDPESARFGTMAAAQTPKGTFACGYINAKNTFGGYTGDQVFFGKFNAGTFEVSGINNSLALSECHWFGVKI